MRRRRGEDEQEHLQREATAPASGPSPRYADVLALQRSAGNAAVARLLSGPTVQRAIERRDEKGNHRFASGKEYLGWLLDHEASAATAYRFRKDQYRLGLLEAKIKQPAPVTVVATPEEGAALFDSLVRETGFVKQFQPGDKAYGMEEEARGTLVEAVGEAKKQGAWPTVDTIHNHSAIQLMGGVEKGKQLLVSLEEVKDKLNPQWKEVYEYLKLLLGGDRKLDQTTTFGNIQRACKVALVHFTKGAHIRFELAGINMDRVVHELKETRKAGEQPGITGVELRSVFRSALQQAGIIPAKAGRGVGLGNVVFYLNGEQIPAPWEWPDAPPEWTSAWDEYKRYLVKKHPMPEKKT